MYNRIVVGHILLGFAAIFFVIGGVGAVTGTNETGAAGQLTAYPATYQITVTQVAHGTIVPGTIIVDFGATPSFTITPDAGYHIASITANGAAVNVTAPSGQSYKFRSISSNGSLTAIFAINTPSLELVLAAVIIVAAIIFIWRLPESKYKSKDALATHEKQEINSVKEISEKIRNLEAEKNKSKGALATHEKQEINSVKEISEKIRNLEAEKKNLLLEIEELKKTADAKVAALENEVNALREEVKSLKP